MSSEKYREIVRYTWKKVSPYQLALSIRGSAYLSHGTAVFLRGLTDQIPTTIYVNAEQSPKESGGLPLTQKNIDLALSRQQRTSNYNFTHEGQRFVLISGKNTARLEVANLTGPFGEPLDVTKVERTLIDIAVRPYYSGGIYHVLEAYKKAKDRVSVTTLVATLKKLNYTYPYHQVIGFYMQRAGYEETWYNLLKKMGLTFDFYLTYGMQNREYDSKWRLYFPKGF